jgi:hypothetical protein
MKAIPMALDGTYGCVYCGTNGVGLGLFSLKDGIVVGGDFVGGRYRGTATEDTASGEITLDLTFEIPPGVWLVQGTSAQDMRHSRRITQTLPPAFGDGSPVEFDTPPGIVTAMIKRVPDDFEPAAVHGFKIQPNSPPAE